MQRPTTSGRRHNRAGSVSVAELIGKQPPPLRIRSRDRDATREFPPEPFEPAPVRVRPVPRPTRRAARLAGVLTGVVVLLAAVVAASLLASRRDTGPDRPRVEAPPAISGPSALRPDVLSAELDDSPVDQAADGRSADGRRVGQPVGQPAVDVPMDVDVPMAVDVPPADTVVMPPIEPHPGPNAQVDAVRRFYGLLPAKPAEAARLLAPELLGGDVREFAAAWGRVQAITIESTTPLPDGAVLAAVSMQERTGRWLRVEQLFRLSDTTVPRIVGTEVLSAQQG